MSTTSRLAPVADHAAHRRSARMGAIAVGAIALGIMVAPIPAVAQSAGEPDTVCQTVDMGGTRLLKLKDAYTRTIPIELPAGTVDITRARAWDAYVGRSKAGVQTSERYEVEFLDSAGNVVATSAPTGDVPDGLEEAEWVGPLGTVELPVAIAGVRAHHRNDLPADDSPDSVNAGDFTVCFTAPSPETTTPETTTPETTAPETTIPQTTTPDTTTSDTTAATGSTTAPTEPTTVDTNPAGPIVQTPSTVAPTTPTTATPTTGAPTTATTVKPQAGATLPVTGASSWLIVLAGTVLLSLGWGLRQVAGHLE